MLLVLVVHCFLVRIATGTVNEGEDGYLAFTSTIVNYSIHSIQRGPRSWTCLVS